MPMISALGLVVVKCCAMQELVALVLDDQCVQRTCCTLSHVVLPLETMLVVHAMLTPLTIVDAQSS